MYVSYGGGVVVLLDEVLDQHRMTVDASQIQWRTLHVVAHRAVGLMAPYEIFDDFYVAGLGGDMHESSAALIIHKSTTINIIR